MITRRSAIASSFAVSIAPSLVRADPKLIVVMSSYYG